MSHVVLIMLSDRTVEVPC